MSRVAALMLGLLMIANVQAAELGRLFYTPMQRNELDRKRLLKVDEAQGENNRATDLVINGRISASSGRSTTWINGAPDYGSVTNRSDVKVGQSIDP
ncbi:MAG TPA: hypothetical protein VJU83_08970, partial [Burkholderiales bacterium]|nr:hypothetical protein [Burkholderiales bacterium]